MFFLFQLLISVHVFDLKITIDRPNALTDSQGVGKGTLGQTLNGGLETIMPELGISFVNPEDILVSLPDTTSELYTPP